jgi:hypothetical protein
MNLILEAAVIVCFLTAASLAFVFHKLVSRGPSLTGENECQWLPFQQVSPERYFPMERLLDGRDFGYLAAHPGFDRQRLRMFRSQRREAFRCYLACLSQDHTRVCAAIKMLMVQSAQDRPDLATILLRQRVTFSLGMMSVELSLSLHALGIRRVRVQNLIHSLDGMRLELENLLVLPALKGSESVLEDAPQGIA